MTRRWGCIGLAIFGVAALVFRPQIRPMPRLLYNPSPSAPIGWYRVLPQETYQRGDLVASSLPEDVAGFAEQRGYLPRGAPVIKTIGAQEGELYCVTATGLNLEGYGTLTRLPTDGQGRVLIGLDRGCRSVKSGHILLVSAQSTGSFDGRYFGETPVGLVLGRAEYLGTVEGLSSRNDLEVGWARGLGADGKIKAHGSMLGLTPCLHINFYGATNKVLCPGLKQTGLESACCRGSNSRKCPAFHLRQRP